MKQCNEGLDTMQVIHNKKSILQSIFAPRKPFTGRLKWSAYTLLTDVEEGCLAWNELTCVMILLPGVSADEARANPDTLPDREKLYRMSFLVPLDMDEGKRLKDAEPILQKLRYPVERREFTIFTTLDCNARCPYCYELGAPHSTMSEETALDAVKFIQSRYDGKQIRICWYGGEPLVNVRVIDLISRELTKAGVDFDSRMFSNSYLFDADMIRRAKECWNLKLIHIALDGTEEVYNRTKNYVNTGRGNPFRTVLDHIDGLLDAGIHVAIRLNFSLENIENLMALVDQLAERFAGRANLHVYGQPLHKYYRSNDSETVETIFGWYKVLTERLEQYHLLEGNPKLPKGHAANYCIADIDACFTILPTGKIAKCDHDYDEDAVGDIWQGVTDPEGVARCKRRVSQQEERCKTCLLFPSCGMIAICPIKCVLWKRLMRTYRLERQMRSVYKQWKEERNEAI